MKINRQRILLMSLSVLFVLISGLNDKVAAQGITEATCLAAGNSYYYDNVKTPFWYNIAEDALHDASRWKEIFRATQDRIQSDPKNFRYMKDPNGLHNHDCLALPPDILSPIPIPDGEINVLGSSTVSPLFDYLKSAYETYARQSGHTVNITVTAKHSGDGIAAICNLQSNVDIAMSSRRMTQDEMADCHVDIVGFVVGADAIMLVVNGSSLLPLTQVFSIQDVADLVLGNTQPNLVRYYPNQKSGTSYVVASVLGSQVSMETINFLNQMLNQPKNKVLLYPSDDIIVPNVVADPDGFGITPYSFYKTAIDQGQAIRALNISCVPALVQGVQSPDPLARCPAPYFYLTQQTITTKQYPLSRPVFIYVRVDQVQDSNDPLYSFLHYVLDPKILPTAHKEAKLFEYPVPISQLQCLEMVHNKQTLPVDCDINNLALYP